MSNVEDTLARIYTINFSKAWLTPKHKRTDRVINMIKEFATKTYEKFPGKDRSGT